MLTEKKTVNNPGPKGPSFLHVIPMNTQTDNRSRCALAYGSALSGLENCPLHRRTPFGMTNVSMTQFSIARHSMGCTLNGDHYIYVPQTDELIRADVLKWKKKHEKAKPNTSR